MVQKGATKYARSRSKLHFVVPKPANAPKEKAPRAKRVVKKNDSKLVAAARELRDRWMEHANANPEMLLPSGKYEVSRALPDPDQQLRIENRQSLPALPPIPNAIAA